MYGPRVELEPAFGDGVRPGHELTHERPEIHGSQTRREAPPLEPVQIEQDP